MNQTEVFTNFAHLGNIAACTVGRSRFSVRILGTRATIFNIFVYFLLIMHIYIF